LGSEFYFCHHIYATSFSTPASLPMGAKSTHLCNFMCECLSLTFTVTQNWHHIMSIFCRLWADRLRNCGQIPSRGKKFFSSPKCPGHPWGPPSLLNRHWELFLQFVKLTTHLLLEPRLRMHEPVCTFPHMPSYCGI